MVMSEKVDRIFHTIIMLGVGITIGIAIGSALARHGEKQNAINAGVARYEANPTSGETRFIYGPATAEATR